MPLKRHSDPADLPNVVRMYLDAGWTGVLPLPRGQKFPPPNGFTGSHDDPPSHAALWQGTTGEFNLALRAPVGVIGIDVDTYGDKNGYQQLRDLAVKYGTLPDTWVSSSRDEPSYSGIRWYRVPAGTVFPGNIAKDIEIIQRHHRYAVAFPSVVEERLYDWCYDGHVGEIPRVCDLPMLPAKWVAGLQNGNSQGYESSSGLHKFRAPSAASFAMDESAAADKLRRTCEAFYASQPGDNFNTKLFQFAADIAGYCAGMGLDEEETWDTIVSRTLVHSVYGSTWDGIDHADKATMQSGMNKGTESPWSINVTTGEATEDEFAPRRLLKRMETPSIEVVDYLWKGGILSGAITLLAGPPGTGKSTFTYSLAAEVTRGMVQGDYYGEPGYVIICSTEDSPAKAIVPRLTVHGADMDKILWVDVDGGFTFPDDVEQLRSEIEALDAPVRLMILDPLVNRLGSDTNTYKDSDVRKALEPVQTMAESMEIAILGIMHNNKATDTDPLNNISGAVAFGGVARAVLTLSKADDYEETGERTIGIVKNNYGSDTIPAYRYRIESVELDPTTPHREGKKATTSKLVWVKKSDVTQTQEISYRKRTERQQREDKNEDGRAQQKGNAKDWVLSFLNTGPKSRHEIDHAAEKATGGPSKATLGRALKELKEDGTLTSEHGVWQLYSASFRDMVERVGELPNGVQLPGHPYGGVMKYQPTPAGVEMIRTYATETGDADAIEYLEGLSDGTS